MSKLKNVFNHIRHNYYEVAKILMFLIAALLVFWQMPRIGKLNYEYQKARPWQHQTLYAPFDFPIYKSQEMLDAENEAARKSVRLYFDFNDAEKKEARNSLLEAFNAEWPQKSTFNKARNEAFLLKVFDTVQGRGIVAYNKTFGDLTPESMVNLVQGKVVQAVPFGRFITMNAVSEKVNMFFENDDADIDAHLLSSLLLSALRQNVSYNEPMTQADLNKALMGVSLTYGMVQKDELIVSEGEIVNERSFAMLNSLQREMEGHTLSASEARLSMLGQLVFIFAIFALMYFYMRLFQKEAFESLRKINMVLLLMLLLVLPSFWILCLHPSYFFAMPVAILSILLVTFFNARLAFVVQMFAVLLISLALSNPYQYVFMQIIATVLVVIVLHKRFSRIFYFWASISVLLAYLVVYLTFSLINDIDVTWQALIVYGLNAVFTLLSLPLIILFERMFKQITPLSLLELSNTNSPLLRKLAVEAPGTFQHSLQVANLCDEVLNKIGGDPLLARTGALYHDIGKLNNPMYFTENQRGGYNLHNDLTNEESAQIIISHVIQGVEMAQKARIPEQVIDFIRQHHGTRRTGYFYAKEKLEHPDEEIDPRPFTYNGPVPSTKETAVLMIADSVEAVSRSLKDPDENSISQMVDRVIDQQMSEGQFRNANLTMHDFTEIRNVLKHKLSSIYHVRIAYPK